ncbi:LacI family DNA-binding transcriptional regulator [Cognatishimia maritima]|uniref:LacI family DNA-binding transcriptional regulator n=1 Tax=Cognatishimia maritima TaxID=870908 RepID=UPI00093505F5|nr:LacI family DNA-binding transcriptional regulator [Cognatishimia maritima]
MQSKSDSVKPIRPRRVTASEVAQAAGVSRSAVLRAYMPGALLTPSKKERILRIANKLGFVPETSETLTQNAPTNLIAVFLAGADSVWLEHLCAALTREGKWPIVLTDPGLQQTDSLTVQLGFAVEALVLPAGLHDDWANRVSQQDQIPLIFSGGIERMK